MPALLRKSEIARIKMLRSARDREKPNAERSEHWVFLKITKIFPVSSKRALRIELLNHRYKQGSPAQYLGGTEVVCRLGHEIALDMAISQFAARARHTVAVRIMRRSPQFAAHAAFRKE